MAVPADPAALYSDIAAEGGFGAALQAAALQNGLSVPVTASRTNPLRAASVVSRGPHRNDLTISAWAVERRWSIYGDEAHQNQRLIQGATPSVLAGAELALLGALPTWP